MDEKKIDGRMRGIVLYAWSTDDDGNATDGRFYLYPPEHTPSELIDMLKQMITFIQKNEGASFCSDFAE